jgi:hypothetical protein
MKTSRVQHSWDELKIAFRESPGLFFAPIIGAFKYTNAEWNRVFAEAKARSEAYHSENAETESAKEINKPA